MNTDDSSPALDRHTDSSSNPRGPWGPWATLGIGAILAAAALAAQLVGGVVLLLVAEWTRNPVLDVNGGGDLGGNGLYWAVATLASAPVELGLILAATVLRRGYPVRDYLALHSPGARRIGQWLLVLVLFAVACDTVTWLAGRPIVPDVMVLAYQTAGYPALLWVAMIVAAPVSEEFLFRGFLFRGLECSALGPVGTIILTSLLWSAVHVQYDLYGITIIFLAGLLFGFARWRTGSIYPCVLMHGLMNLVATFQAMLASQTQV